MTGKGDAGIVDYALLQRSGNERVENGKSTHRPLNPAVNGGAGYFPRVINSSDRPFVSCVKSTIDRFPHVF